jgi:hypothetical protein
VKVCCNEAIQTHAGNITISTKYVTMKTLNSTNIHGTDPHYGNPNAPFIANVSVYAYCVIGVLLQFICGMLLSLIFHNRESRQRAYRLTYWGRNMDTPIRPDLDMNDMKLDNDEHLLTD